VGLSAIPLTLILARQPLQRVSHETPDIHSVCLIVFVSASFIFQKEDAGQTV
jgi:hypothetical protein